MALLALGGSLIFSAIFYFLVIKPESVELPDNVKISELIHNQDQFLSFLKKRGVKYAMEKLIAESGGGSAFDCHQQAHLIGRLGYKSEGSNVFASCDYSCHSGCYHGAMESFLNEKGTANLAANIKGICDTFNIRFGIFECLHGIGHGLLAYFDYDLPAAIEECKKLNDDFAVNSCYGGLFMENILTGQGLGAKEKGDHETKWVNKTDPQYPCDGIDKNFNIQFQCYQMQTSWMLTIFNHDFTKVAMECLKAPKELIPVCYKSYGRDASGDSLRDPVKIKELCGKAPPGDYRNQCAAGAVNVIIDFWGPGLKNQAADLCRILDEPEKNICYVTLTGRLKDLFNTKEERDKICQEFEEKYKDICLQI